MAEGHEIDKAVELLAQGDVIGLPTETVYGLAASIVSEKGTEKIFRIKERPFFDPLIVHVANRSQLESVVEASNEAMECLIKSFWPGPLTLVVPKNKNLNPMITSGLQTVGVRMPEHSLALALIEKAGPVAAPSANKFGKTSPTTAAHVREEFGEDSLFVLDGGPSHVGIESTILGISKNGDLFDLVLHRPGVLTRLQIEEALDAYDLKYQWLERSDSQVEAPGQVKHHYMPKIPLVVLDERYRTLKLSEILEEHFSEALPPYEELVLPNAAPLAARLLYSELREKAESGAGTLIYYYNPVRFGSIEWSGLSDRLTRAASLILDWKS